jgi:hypothetical protein
VSRYNFFCSNVFSSSPCPKGRGRKILEMARAKESRKRHKDRAQWRKSLRILMKFFKTKKLGFLSHVFVYGERRKPRNSARAFYFL